MVCCGKIRFSTLVLFFLLVGYVVFPSICVFADVGEMVHITSRRADAELDTGVIRFIGDVVAVQGDTTLYAEEMVLTRDRQTRQVTRIEAHRQVRIEQGERLATGQKAVFDRVRNEMVMTGSPRISQGEDFVEGEEIVFLLDSDRSIVRSKGDGRVRAVFHPQERTSE